MSYAARIVGIGLTGLLTTALATGCDVGPGDDRALLDGSFGDATTCKPVPDLVGLEQPRIDLSIEGLTLRLTDEAGDYDETFPIGVGAIDTDPGSSTYQESLTYFPLLVTGSQEFEVKPLGTTACKIWWTDPATGTQVPVFAGLPFIQWYGNYGIHGPVTDYDEPDGGNLRRGFVSHGCIRMEGDDVLEVFARIQDADHVTVHVQREAGRTDNGRRVDVAARWIGAECRDDAECAFDGGFCHVNEIGGRGFCAARCDRYCDDLWGQPTTFCVDDPQAAGEGMCVLREEAQNLGCRSQDHMQPAEAARHGEPDRVETVCMPGSRGWVGDRCLDDGDCSTGNHCQPVAGEAHGVCTQACEHFCPDQPGTPWTYCVDEPELGGATCLRECTPDSNGSECPAGFACEERMGEAPGNPVKFACVPSGTAY